MQRHVGVEARELVVRIIHVMCQTSIGPGDEAWPAVVVVARTERHGLHEKIQAYRAVQCLVQAIAIRSFSELPARARVAGDLAVVPLGALKALAEPLLLAVAKGL